jgi:uncharacterized iron-regulated membrane protein
MQMRTVHRLISIFVVVFTLYLGVTGTLIETVDFKTLITNPTAFDPDLMAMREDFAGPPNFRVLGTADNVAATLPAEANLSGMLNRVVESARAQLGSEPLKFVELRMADGHPVGQVQTGKDIFRYDAATGAALGASPKEMNEDQPPAATRNVIKHLHRMTTFGDWALWINIVVAIALSTLIVTGFWIYWKVYAGRQKLGRQNPFWMAGGIWRALHRSISIVCIIFLTIITLSGSWLAVESLCFGLYNQKHNTFTPGGVAPPDTIMFDASKPLTNAELPGMLSTTLAAYHKAMPGHQIRVVRLRYYGTMSQGVVISDGEAAQQLAFDTSSGRRVSLTEPGYPKTGFPFGWQAHQYAKSIHRGDFFGLTGRIMSLLAGLAMVYLSISGVIMYYDMWKKRSKAGRKEWFWTEKSKPAAPRTKA